MSITAVSTAGHEALLLRELFVKSLKEKLELEATDAIRPAIRREIDKVVAELNASIQSHYEAMTNRTVAQLIVSIREDRK